MITVIGIKSKFGTYLLSRVQIIRSRARCRSRLWQEEAARSPRQPLAGRVKEQGTLVKVARGVAAPVGSNSGFLVNPRTRRQTPLRQAICAERKPQAGCPPIRESHVSGAPGRHNARQPGPACDAVPPHNAREKSGRHAKFPPKSMVRCLRLHPSFALNVLTQQIRKSPAGDSTPISGPAESGCGEDQSPHDQLLQDRSSACMRVCFLQSLKWPRGRQS
jgi:hypothetical protein